MMTEVEVTLTFQGENVGHKFWVTVESGDRTDMARRALKEVARQYA